jgi:hypothetical protein
LEKLPWLSQYEGAWPVEVCTQNQLYRYRVRERKRHAQAKASSAARASPFAANVAVAQTASISTSPCVPAASPASSATSAYTTAVFTQKPTTNPAAAPAIITTSSVRVSGATSESASALVANSSVCSAESNSDDTILTFLRSIRTSMGALAPLFTQAGVLDSADLDAIAGMPRSEQAEFLQDDIKLSLLQARLVRYALIQRRDEQADAPQ